MTSKYILGNWKMYCTQGEAKTLAAAVAAIQAPAGAKVAIFPPFTALGTAAEALEGSAVSLGAQDVSPQPYGAFTGDISAAMLKDAGCAYVIVGHSERRALHGETSEQVQAKAQAAMEAGLVPVICVGESLEQRESGSHLTVIGRQVQESLPSLSHSSAMILAYEPVWAIGSGKTPTLPQITEVHKFIASLLSCATSGARTAIVYGGSVKAASARDILTTEGVDGVLVGGASLKAEEFGAIIAAA